MNVTKRLIIAGGRDFFPNRDHLRWIYSIIAKVRPEEIVSGCAKGADRFGERVALAKGIKVVRFPADWDRYGKRAGRIRNESMAKYAEYLAVFPGGKGTAHMKEIAKAYGLVVFEYPGAERHG